jgi:DNA-binding beta-propeller fold protein YncE
MRKHRTLLPVFAVTIALLVFSAGPGMAAVEWEIQKSLTPGARPLDVAVSADGRSIYVLTDDGNILIYGSDGALRDKIAIGPQAERIAVDPDGERLYVTNRQTKRVDVVQVDTIYDIKTAGSPFKGREKAPVVVTVFSDFQ